MISEKVIFDLQTRDLQPNLILSVYVLPGADLYVKLANLVEENYPGIVKRVIVVNCECLTSHNIIHKACYHGSEVVTSLQPGPTGGQSKSCFCCAVAM